MYFENLMGSDFIRPVATLQNTWVSTCILTLKLHVDQTYEELRNQTPSIARLSSFVVRFGAGGFKTIT